MTTTIADMVARYAAAAREATEARDEAIRQMIAEGASLRKVGDAAGLSHTAISKIVQKG